MYNSVHDLIFNMLIPKQFTIYNLKFSYLFRIVYGKTTYCCILLIIKMYINRKKQPSVL